MPGEVGDHVAAVGHLRALQREGLIRHLGLAKLQLVAGLGEQQLPDGRRAGQYLQPVASLLAGYGVPGGIHQDAQLQQVLHEQCGVSDSQQLWSTLPYMLALTFTLPKWASVKPDLSQARRLRRRKRRHLPHGAAGDGGGR